MSQGVERLGSLDMLRRRARDAGVDRRYEEIPFLVAAMQSAQDDGRLRLSMVAGLALAQFGLVEVVRAATPLREGSPCARIALAYSLGKTCDPRAIPTLRNLANDADEEVVLWASLALADVGESSIEALLELLGASGDSLSRSVFFADALVKIGSSDALAGLLNHLEGLDANRAEALRSILSGIQAGSEFADD